MYIYIHYTLVYICTYVCYYLIVASTEVHDTTLLSVCRRVPHQSRTGT